MKKKGLLLWLVVMGVALTLLLCGSVFAKEKFGIAFLGDLTGPLGFWNAPRLVAIQDAVEHLNKNYGGIGGREIYIDWADHRSKIDIATSGYERLKAKGYAVWHTCGTGEQQMLKQRYEGDKSQLIFTCSASPGVIYPAGYVFGTAGYFPDEWGVFFEWLNETWDFKKMGRGPKVAVLTYPSGYGKTAINDEIKDYAKKQGVEIVDTIFIPFVTVDATTPLMRAKKAGADWVFGSWLYQTIPPYLKENKKLNLGLKFAVNTFGVDDVIVAAAGDAAIGLTGISNWNFLWEDTPGMKIIRETLKTKFRRPEDRGASYILGWMNTWQTKRVVEDTLKRFNGDWSKITPKNLRETAESWGKTDIMGIGTMAYSKDRRGATEVRVVQVQKVRVNGKQKNRWVPITDWRNAPNLTPGKWRKPLGY
jgi:branched-chain amino acid transport system substrate-binding protein